MKSSIAEIPTITLPALSAGEVYSGLILNEDGTPDYHLIKLPGAADDLTWKKAGPWALKAGGELPNLRELGLLRVNARAHFQDTWYWSSEQHASNSDYAWFQTFSHGGQGITGKSAELCAVAVRRVAIG